MYIDLECNSNSVLMILSNEAKRMGTNRHRVVVKSKEVNINFHIKIKI